MDNSQVLSNKEVLKVLQHRKKHSEISKQFKEYLELIDTNEDIYLMDELRKIKDIQPETLCVVANMQSTDFVMSNYDKRKIEKLRLDETK